MQAQTVLEELTRDELTRDHIEHRVSDWAKRVEDLYDSIGSWLPAGWTARRGAPVQMREEVMSKMQIPARDLPTVELISDGKVGAFLRPYGLWIIGANGRIDLVKDGRLYLILDQAKTFETPNWQIAPATKRGNAKSLNERELQQLLTA